MARPKKDDKKIQYTVMVEPSVIEEIKKLAEKAEMPAGTLARNCLKMGLDDARLLDKGGFIKMVGASRRKIDQIKKLIDFNSQKLRIFRRKKARFKLDSSWKTRKKSCFSLLFCEAKRFTTFEQKK